MMSFYKVRSEIQDIITGPKYSQGPKVIPQKYFPVDFRAFACLQEN